MGGQRNGKFLRYFIGLVCLLVFVYILYGYSQAHSQLKIKNSYLSIAEDEHKALSKRFDMLSSELKNTVQTVADLEKQLRVGKGSHEQTIKEKEEQGRQCKTEESRKESEKVLLEKEKLQLTEEKDQFKRERDRLSSQFDTLTQECSDARDAATNLEHQIRADCDARVNESGAKKTAQGNKLATCKATLEEANSNLFHCNREVNNVRSDTEQCQLQLEMLTRDQAREKERNREKERLQEKQQQQPNKLHNNQDQDYRRGQRSQFGGNKGFEQQSFQASKHQRDPAPYRKEKVGVDSLHNSLQDYGGPKGGGMPLNKTPVESRVEDSNNGAHGRDGLEGRDLGGEHHVSLADKRLVYQNLKEKLNRGELLDENRSKLFRSLSKLFGSDPPPLSQEQEVKFRDHQEQVPSLPARQKVPVRSHPAEQEVRVPSVAGNNNEQEEVKDLVDGQQKVDVNVVGGAGGGAGVPREERDVGVVEREVSPRGGGGGYPDQRELDRKVVDNADPLPASKLAQMGDVPAHDGDDGANVGRGDPSHQVQQPPSHHDSNNQAPLEKPAGEQLEENDDDDDGGDARGVAVVNNEGDDDEDDDYPGAAGIEHHKDDGHKDFMQDQRLFDEERRILNRRSKDRENEVGERDPLANRQQENEQQLVERRRNPAAPQNHEMK